MHVLIWAAWLKKDVKNVEGIKRRIQKQSKKENKLWRKALKQKILICKEEAKSSRHLMAWNCIQWEKLTEQEWETFTQPLNQENFKQGPY